MPSFRQTNARSRGQHPVMKIHVRDQVKWLTDALIRLHLEFCIFTKRLFYKKSHVLNQAIAALRPSVGLPGQFLTV